MSVNTIASIDLNKPEIFAFLRNNAATSWDAPVTPPVGYVASAAPLKPSGTISEYAAGKPIALIRSVREYYEVLEGPSPGQNVGNFDVVVPIERTVHVHVSAALFIQAGVTSTNATKIENVFGQYEYPRDGDPNQYVHEKLNENGSITADMFLVGSTYSVEKVGPDKIWGGERERILDAFNGKGDGSVIPGENMRPIPIDGGDSKGFFERRQLRAVLLRSEDLDGVPEKVRDLHEVTSKDPKNAIKEIANLEGKAAGCDAYVLKEWKIADLVDYYEWRWRWKDFHFRIGCIHIFITLPVQQSRESRISLWAYARYPQNLGNLVETAINDCAWKSALASAVIAVVLWNFPVGLAAFKALFTECIRAKFGNAVSCLIPGLVLNTEVVNDWH